MVMPISRRILILGAVAAPTLPFSAYADCGATKVLFVCPAGTVKSAIAREALRKAAHDSSIPLVVQSRGISPEDHVSPVLAARLKADGLNPAAEPALRFAAADALQSDIVIAFDEAASAPGLEQARAWTTPSWSGDYDRAKADLKTRLDLLLAELAQRRANCD